MLFYSKFNFFSFFLKKIYKDLFLFYYFTLYLNQ